MFDIFSKYHLGTQVDEEIAKNSFVCKLNTSD